MCRTRKPYDVEQVRRLGETTIAYYDRFAPAFWDGTRHHDVSQNYAAFLNAVESDPPYSILDLGCGPGRSATFDRWGTKPWGSMGLSNSLPWRERTQAARSCIRICWLCDCPRAALTGFLPMPHCSMCR